MTAPRLRLRPYWAALGWALVLGVVWLSLTPTPPDSGLPSGDKLGHLMAYAALMGWWRQLDPRGGRLALSFLFMGLALELLQGLGGHRQADAADMAANALGVGLGWLSTRLAPDWLARLEGRPGA